jgi:hypothetical protein
MLLISENIRKIQTLHNTGTGTPSPIEMWRATKKERASKDDRLAPSSVSAKKLVKSHFIPRIT